MPQPPAGQGGGKKKTGLIIGAVAVVAAIGVGAYFVFGGGGGAGGLEDDGPHKLATPETVLGEYKRVTKDGATTGDDSAEDMEKSGIKNGKSAFGVYSTADPTSVDPSDPSSVPTDYKTVTVFGAYGEIADPEAALDQFFRDANKSSRESSGSDGEKAELIGEPEDVELDGAVMKCQAAKGKNPETKKVKTDWFCAWADYSTIAMVSPGEVTNGIGKDTAVDLTTKLREEIRVKA